MMQGEHINSYWLDQDPVQTNVFKEDICVMLKHILYNLREE